MADGSEDLKILFPGEDVKVGSETIRVKPFYFGQWPRAVKLAAPLVRLVNESGVMDRSAPDWTARLIQLLETGGEPLMEFIAFAVGKERKWLDTVEGDDGLALANAVFSQNVSFFERKIMPLLSGVVVEPKAVGEPSLPDSLPLDIDGATSPATP